MLEIVRVENRVEIFNEDYEMFLELKLTEFDLKMFDKLRKSNNDDFIEFIIRCVYEYEYNPKIIQLRNTKGRLVRAEYNYKFKSSERYADKVTSERNLKSKLESDLGNAKFIVRFLYPKYTAKKLAEIRLRKLLERKESLLSELAWMDILLEQERSSLQRLSSKEAMK